MNATIRTKLILSFSLVLLCSVTLGLFSIQRLDVVNGAASKIEVNWLPATQALGEFSYVTMRVRQLEATHILAEAADKSAEEATIIKVTDQAEKTFQAYLTALPSEEQQHTALIMKEQWDNYKKIDEHLRNLSNSNQMAAAAAYYRGEARQLFNKFQDDLKNNSSVAVRQGAAAADDGRQIGQTARALILLALLATAFVSIGAGFGLVRSVSRPLALMTQAMLRIARQEYQTIIPGADRGDEIGSMAKAVLVFKDNGLSMQRMEAEERDRQRAEEETRAQREAERTRLAAQQAEVVTALAHGLSQLAEGNLTCELNNPFAPDYEGLRGDFNSAVCSLREAVAQILVHSQAIDLGTSEIANATQDLARRTEQQAANLEQTAAALDQVTTGVQQTASGSGQVQTIVAAAHADTLLSDKVMREAVGAMGEIEDSARQIGQIIGVIDEIAFQTNLLALNAGVEAARAGESGRGFAVVASEVRALAQRAADAAKQIKALVITSMKHVERGVQLVSETGNTLTRIQASVSTITTSIGNIVEQAKEQSAGLGEVNIAVNQMDQVTQQNAAMVEESSAATHALSQETQQLNAALARFRVADSGSLVRHARAS